MSPGGRHPSCRKCDVLSTGGSPFWTVESCASSRRATRRRAVPRAAARRGRTAAPSRPRRSRSPAPASTSPGSTRSTRGSARHHLRSACAQVSTPKARSGSSAPAARLAPQHRRAAPPSGRITITATPSSSASGRIRASHSRSSGLSGICTVSNLPVRNACSSSPNCPASQCVTPSRSTLPASRSASSHATARARPRGCGSARSRPGRRHAAAPRTAPCPPRPSWPRSSSPRPPSPRRPCRALPSDASAAPYIGDESNTVVPAPSAAPTTSAARRSSSRNVLYVPSPIDRSEPPLLHHRTAARLSRAPRARADPPRMRRRRTTGRRPRDGPCASGTGSRTPRASRSTSTSTTSPISASRPRPEGQTTSRSPRMSLSAERVWCETPPWRSRGSRPEYLTTTMARPPSAAVGVGRVGHREATVPERRAAADDARPDAADDDIEALRLRPRERRGRGERLDVAVEARRHGDGRLEQLPRLQQAHRVRQRHRQRTSCELHVRDPHARCRCRRRPGASWLCNPQHTTGSPSSCLRERVVLLDAGHGGLPGRVREAPSRAPRRPAAIRAPASGSHRRCRSRRSRDRGRAPAC